MVQVKAGKGTMKNVVYSVLGFFLMAILAPIAIGTIANATTGTWDASVVTIFQVVLPIVYVIGAALAFLDF